MANNLTPKEEFLLNPVTEHNITDAAIATFETNLRHGVKVEVPFTPKQDLHGYDHPWPPGGGKNLFNLNRTLGEPTPNTSGGGPSVNRTFNTSEYILGFARTSYYQPNYISESGYSIANDTISLTRNSNSDSYGIAFPFELTAGATYIISGTVTNGKFGVAFYGEDGVFLSQTNLFSGMSFIVPADAVQTLIVLCTDTGDATFINIQLELGSTATAYEPYSNICPIEGYTECEVEHTGKNLFAGYIQKTRIKPGVLYTVSSAETTGAKRIHFAAYNSNGERIWPVLLKGTTNFYVSNGLTIMLAGDQSKLYGKIGLQNPDASYIVAIDNTQTAYHYVNYNEIQLELGSTATDYEPYQGKTIPISWKYAEGTYEFSPVQEGSGDPSPENVRPIHPGLTITRDDNTELTVYGGSITFNDDGTSRVESVHKRIDAHSSWRFAKQSSTGWYMTLTDMPEGRQNSKSYCNVLTKKLSQNSTEFGVTFGYDGANRLIITGSQSLYPNDEDLSSYLSEIGAYFIYPRNNPEIYTLSITETQRVIEALGDKVSTVIYDGTVTLNEDGSADIVSDAQFIDLSKKQAISNYNYTFNGITHHGVGLIEAPKPHGAGSVICTHAIATNGISALPFQNGASNVLWINGNQNYLWPGILDVLGFSNYTEYNAWVQTQSIGILYPLATPITYHFPNVGKLKAFLGTNNIWSDIGNVNVKYLTQNSETGMEYRGDRALELRRRAMIADAPTIHTTTGSEETGGLASFKSYVKAPVKKIEIPFAPKQDLHGYDYPWPPGGGKNLFNKDGTFVDHVVIKSETAYKLASGTGSTISTVTPGTTVLLNETVDNVTKLKPWIYLGLDESGNARLYREKADDEPRQIDANTANVSYDGCDMDEYLIDETTGFLSRFDSSTLGALVATSIKYVDYFATGDNTASVQTISRKCFLPSYSEMGYGDDPAGNEGQSYLAALKTYYENNTDNTVRIGKTEDRTAYKTWLRSGQGTANSRYRNIMTNGQIGYDNSNTGTNYIRPMISLDPNTVVETVTFGKDTFIQNTTLYTDPITVSPSTAYVLSGRCYTNQVMRVNEYDANDNFLRSTVSTAMNHPSVSFTTTENTAYVLVNPDWVIQFIQLEAGASATSYAPYSNICPIEGYSNGISYSESKKANIYGARWDRLQHRLTRYGAAEDFDTDVTNFRINGEVSSSYDNPFDDLYPWSERKLCNINLTQYMALQNGSSITDCVTHWEGETGFSYDNPDGVWVYTPKFWGRSYDDANGHRCFEVADRPVHDFIEYDEQITARWRGVVEERTINGESKQVLLPKLGNPGRYTPVNTLHTYAKNYGGSVTSIYSIDPSYLLMIVEFASMNPRLDVGGGVNSLYRQNAADKIAENATDSTVIKLPNSYATGMISDALIDIGTANGGNQIGSRWIVSAELDENTNLWTVTLNEPITVTTANFWSIHGMANRPDAAIGSKSGYLGENNRSHAYYRGEELWGNFWMYVIGIYKSARDEVWLCPKNLDPDDYNALNTSVHVNTGVQLSMANGFSREFGYPEKSYELSASALSVLNGGNATDPSGSQFYTATRNARILIVGGNAYNGTAVGFCWNWNITSSASDWYCGASPRLKNPPRGLSGGPQSP